MARLGILAAGLAALALNACGDGEHGPVATPAVTPAREAPSLLYRCDNGATVRVAYPDPQTAVVGYQGRTWTLRRVNADSGARYAADGLQWWTKGPESAEVSALAPGEAAAGQPGFTCIVSSRAGDSMPPANPPAPGTPGGLPDERTPIAEGPIDPDSAQGAGQVVQTYYALIEARRYGEAWRLWADQGRASGMDEAAFAASFDRYGEYHANIGAPGRVEGAAGSLYVEIPVQVYGRLKTGAPMTLLGSVGLRRSNETPGAREDQLQWRIAASDLRGAGAGR